MVSLGGIYSNVEDAVAVGLADDTLPALLPQILTATISNNSSWMALARYERATHWNRFEHRLSQSPIPAVGPRSRDESQCNRY